MELYVLPLGDCCCNYEVIAPGVRDGHRTHIPVNAFLVRLPDERLVLVDTGMSRLHVDDPSQLDVAPQDVDATFFVQREQYEHAKGNPSFPNQYWNLPSLSYELLDGPARLFDGIEVSPTPGHCPGHQSIVLRLPETGMVILCGDAVYCQDNFDHGAWEGQADPASARESGHMLRQLATEHECYG